MRSSVVRNYEINECVSRYIHYTRSDDGKYNCRTFIHSFMALLGVPMNWIGVLDNIKSAHKFCLAICAVHKVWQSRMRLRIRGGSAYEAVHKKACSF